MHVGINALFEFNSNSSAKVGKFHFQKRTWKRRKKRELLLVSKVVLNFEIYQWNQNFTY